MFEVLLYSMAYCLKSPARNQIGNVHKILNCNLFLIICSFQTLIIAIDALEDGFKDKEALMNSILADVFQETEELQADSVKCG